MKRIVQINFRATVLLDDRLTHYSDELNISKSSLIHESIIFYLRHKGYKEIERSLKLQQRRDEIREFHHDLYLVKNTFMTVIRMAKMSLLISGRVNYKQIEFIIKKSIAVFNCFPVKTKKMMKDDIDCLKRLKEKPFLMQYLTNYDIVREFIHENKDKRIEMK